MRGYDIGSAGFPREAGGHGTVLLPDAVYVNAIGGVDELAKLVLQGSIAEPATATAGEAEDFESMGAVEVRDVFVRAAEGSDRHDERTGILGSLGERRDGCRDAAKTRVEA